MHCIFVTILLLMIHQLLRAQHPAFQCLKNYFFPVYLIFDSDRRQLMVWGIIVCFYYLVDWDATLCFCIDLHMNGRI